jgi:hypothetical protein
MPDILAKRDMVAELKRKLQSLGLSVHQHAQEGFRGEGEFIRAKWWLGGRKVSYHMSCRLTESDHTIHFRESSVERSWGIPPPTLTVNSTTISGWKRNEKRSDVSVGGGGSLNYGEVRDALEQAATAAGWKFDLEGGRMP